MQPTLCSRCKKNIATVFITRMEGDKTVNEGLCLKCARNLGLPVTFASDSHATEQVAWNFDTLARCAAAEGWKESLVFCRGDVTAMPFVD